MQAARFRSKTSTDHRRRPMTSPRKDQASHRPIKIQNRAFASPALKRRNIARAPLTGLFQALS
jgi:hypothetical protein